MNIHEEILAIAEARKPLECCGLVVARGHHVRLVEGRNLAHNPREDFALDPAAWLEVDDHEKVIGIFHSHPNGPAEPSLADRTSCEASGLPWHIVGLPRCDYVRIEPQGFRAPYLERPYVHHVHDCYALVRDWYNWEWGLGLPDYPREPDWWKKGQNLYLDHFAECGFVDISTRDEVQIGDAFLINVQSPVPNHAAIYVGDGYILHHVEGRLSSKDPFGGYWAKHRFATLRHSSKM